MKTVYVCAWVTVIDGQAMAEYQESSVERFREESVISAGLQRGNLRVRVYSDHVHGIDVLKEDELRLVAAVHLDHLSNMKNSHQ